jgi:hypothetical protein
MMAAPSDRSRCGNGKGGERMHDHTGIGVVKDARIRGVTEVLECPY